VNIDIAAWPTQCLFFRLRLPGVFNPDHHLEPKNSDSWHLWVWQVLPGMSPREPPGNVAPTIIRDFFGITFTSDVSR